MQKYAPPSLVSSATTLQVRLTVDRSASVTVWVKVAPLRIGVTVVWVKPSRLYWMRFCFSRPVDSISPPGVPTRRVDSKSMSSPSLRTPVMLLHAITSVWTAG